MRRTIASIIAVPAGALVPGAYFAVLGLSFRVGILAFVLALLWIIVLGLPVFFILQSRSLASLWSAIVAGFLLGAAPVALFTWPYHPGEGSGYSAWDGHAMVDYVVHGVPTYAGWVQYVQFAGSAGLLGAASAAMFWLAWRLVAGPNHSSKGTRIPRATWPQR